MSDSDSPPLYDINFDESDEFNFVDPWLCSAQILAVRENDLNRLQELVSNGKSVNINDNQGNTPLHHAVLTNNLTIFKFLLSLDEIRLDVENFQGQTPLLLAAKLKLIEFSHDLIKLGADVNLVELSGESVLHYFAAESLTSVELLLAKGIDVNVRDSWGRTPLHIACLNGNVEIIELLLAAGADCHIADENQLLPFTISLTKLPEIQQNHLFLLTYDIHSSVNLRTLTEVMLQESEFYTKLLQLKLTYTELEIDFFMENYLKISTRILRKFMENHFEILQTRNVLYEIFKEFEPNSSISPILLLFETQHITQLVQRLNSNNNFDNFIICQLPENLLGLVIFSLLSFGLELRLYDLLLILRLYGYKDLFKLLLHHQIYVIEDSRILDICCKILNRNGSLRELIVLLERFNPCRHIQCLLTLCEPNKVESVPSLLRLCIVASRDFLICKFQIRNHVEYFTVVKNLTVSEWLKKEFEVRSKFCVMMAEPRLLKHAKLFIQHIQKSKRELDGKFSWCHLFYEQVVISGTITNLDIVNMTNENLVFVIFILDDGTNSIPCVLLVDQQTTTEVFNKSTDFDFKSFKFNDKLSNAVAQMCKIIITSKEEDMKKTSWKGLQIGDDISISGVVEEEKDLRYIFVNKIQRFFSCREKMFAVKEMLRFYEIFFNT